MLIDSVQPRGYTTTVQLSETKQVKVYCPGLKYPRTA